MARSLPAQPNLDHLKREAKSLLKAHAERQAEACDLLRQLNRFTDADDEAILASDVALADVQFALALDYGFSSWRAMRRAVRTSEAADDLNVRELKGDIRIDLARYHDRWGNHESPRSVVGIDISSSNIRMLELSRRDGGYRVECYGVEPLPANVIVQKHFHHIDVIGDALSRLLERVNPSARHAAVAVAGAGLLVRKVEMPRDLSHRDLGRAIEKQVDADFPFPSDEICLDFEVQRPSPSDGSRLEVLFAACRHEAIEVRAAVVERAGLNLGLVDVEPHCLLRARPLLGGADAEDDTVGIADLGATLTSLCVLAPQRTPFVREQLFGGRQLTEEIQRRYALSLEEAELAKRVGDLPEDYRLD